MFRSSISGQTVCCLLALTCMFCQSSSIAEEIQLTSGGPIAFGPDGLLLVSDPLAATIYAIKTGDNAGSAEDVKVEVENVRAKVASLMGVEPNQVRINDLAVNPGNGNTYLSVTRGQGDSEVSVILVIQPGTGEISEFEMAGKKFTKTTFANAAPDKKDRRGNNQRMDSITDMAFVDGQVYVAGLSNEEFASKLRAISFPFKENDNGTSIEIYHGAHGKFETRSPIRTFAAFMVEDEMNLLAAYTCTPLVRIPVSSLNTDEKIKGVTIAELGNRNRPLDMVVYQKDGKDYALMANNARGVMKIDLADTGTQQGISSRVEGGGTAGLNYQTIEDLTGVMQLDGLNATHAVVLVRSASGQEDIRTIVLP